MRVRTIGTLMMVALMALAVGCGTRGGRGGGGGGGGTGLPGGSGDPMDDDDPTPDPDPGGSTGGTSIGPRPSTCGEIAAYPGEVFATVHYSSGPLETAIEIFDCGAKADGSFVAIATSGTIRAELDLARYAGTGEYYGSALDGLYIGYEVGESATSNGPNDCTVCITPDALAGTFRCAATTPFPDGSGGNPLEGSFNCRIP